MKKERYLSQKERNLVKDIIFGKTGYWLKSNSLLIQAFTRKSFTSEYGGQNNEILEFIGDQVLNYYVTKIMSECFGALDSECEFTFRVKENQCTRLKQQFVSNEALSKIMDEWELIDFLIVGKSDYLNGVDKQKKVKADLLEAILGAIAVESKWDTDILEMTVKRMLSVEQTIENILNEESQRVEFDLENSITTLKELAESGEVSVPVYKYSGPEQIGHDEDGNPRWVCSCTIITDKTGIIRQVWTSSKKMAKKAAAYLILCDYFNIQNQYGTNGKYLSWRYRNGRLIPEHMKN